MATYENAHSSSYVTRACHEKTSVRTEKKYNFPRTVHINTSTNSTKNNEIP